MGEKTTILRLCTGFACALASPVHWLHRATQLLPQCGSLLACPLPPDPPPGKSRSLMSPCVPCGESSDLSRAGKLTRIQCGLVVPRPWEWGWEVRCLGSLGGQCRISDKIREGWEHEGWVLWEGIGAWAMTAGDTRVQTFMFPLSDAWDPSSLLRAGAPEAAEVPGSHNQFDPHSCVPNELHPPHPDQASASLFPRRGEEGITPKLGEGEGNVSCIQGTEILQPVAQG